MSDWLQVRQHGPRWENENARTPREMARMEDRLFCRHEQADTTAARMEPRRRRLRHGQDNQVLNELADLDAPADSEVPRARATWAR